MLWRLYLSRRFYIAPYIINYETTIVARSEQRVADIRVFVNFSSVEFIDFIFDDHYKDNKIRYAIKYYSDKSTYNRYEFFETRLINSLKAIGFQVKKDGIVAQLYRDLAAINDYNIFNIYKDACLEIINKIKENYNIIPETYDICKSFDANWITCITYPKTCLKFNLSNGYVYNGTSELIYELALVDINNNEIDNCFNRIINLF